MVDSVGTYASDQYNTALVMQTKATEDQLLQETTSGKKSLSYDGIADVAQQALNLTNENSSISNYLTTNNTVNLNLQGMSQVYSSVQNEISNFQQDLQNYIDNDQGGSADDQQTLQQQAFSALKNMQYYLNTQVNGQYLFSGSDTTTPPFQLNASTLSQFQAEYDGYNTTYGDTSAADLSNTSTSVLNTGSITFNAQNGTISAANPGQFSNLPVGSTVTLTGSAYDGNYSILANDGNTLTVAPSFTAEGDPSTNTYDKTAMITTSTMASQDAGLNIQPVAGVYFSPPGVLASPQAGTFSQLHAGDSFTVSGATDPSNDGNYIVSSVSSDGSSLAIQRAGFTSAPNLDSSGSPDASATISYPTGTSTASLSDATNGINFNSDGTITDNVGGTLLSGVPAGSYITVADANVPSNNGTYLVTANASGTLSVQRTVETSLNDEAANSSAEISNGTATSFSPGALTFDSSSSVVTAANGGSLAGMAVGQTVNVSGSADNDGSYVVTGTFSTPVADEASNTNAQITDGTTSFAGANTGGITFDAASDTMSAANAGSLSGINIGDVIKVSGSASNNGAFVVTGIDPSDSSVTVAPANTAVQVAQNLSLSTSSYYQGNNATVSSEIDNNTPMSYGITAANPAFEKAIRAMALIAEGQTGTAGGLDMNSSRLTAANYLLTSSLGGATSTEGTPPYGAENSGNVSDLSLNLALQQETLSSVTAQQTNFQNFLTTSVGTLTNADPTQTIVELLDQQQALQASYQSLSSVRQLSLLNYLK
ncbi:MAG TPA: hypothetical protein VGG27_16200 [Magnetospirillaceae bacterium]|jgi:flagellin-like hook-associated protein FlgL